MKIFNISSINNKKKNFDAQKSKLDGISNEARKLSKVAIFALQRGDVKKADKDIEEATKLLKICSQMIAKNQLLAAEASYKSGAEEYCEAFFFKGYLNNNITIPSLMSNNHDAVIGGLADLAGEVARYAVIKATEHEDLEIEKAYKLVLNLVDWLASMDLTGSLRSKFDQTKQHLRKIEDIRYDLSQK